MKINHFLFSIHFLCLLLEMCLFLSILRFFTTFLYGTLNQLHLKLMVILSTDEFVWEDIRILCN